MHRLITAVVLAIVALTFASAADAFQCPKLVSQINAAAGNRFDAKIVTAKAKLPAGSYWIPLKQRRARLIHAMLEPQAPDSLARWGFLNSIFEGNIGAGEYLTEPIARHMMADSPGLRKEFEERVKSDAAFAADPRARLAWWMERSKYEPEGAGRYPILRVWEKTW